MKPNERNTREHLIEAAQRVVLQHGASTLTLDAVAREAGVSKGGLLYHFPAKEALITAMIDSLCAAFEAGLAAVSAEETDGPGRFTRCYLRATTAPDENVRAISSALFAAVANDLALVAPFRERMARWQKQIMNDGLDPALATAIRLAADGLWFAELGEFAPPEPDLRQQIVDTLIALTKG